MKPYIKPLSRVLFTFCAVYVGMFLIVYKGEGYIMPISWALILLTLSAIPALLDKGINNLRPLIPLGIFGVLYFLTRVVGEAIMIYAELSRSVGAINFLGTLQDVGLFIAYALFLVALMDGWYEPDGPKS